jgi:hypothetical protein
MWRYGYHDERIRTLENHLYKACYAVVMLLPEPIRDIANSHYSIGSREDAHHWENALVDRIVESATTLSRDEGSYFGPRAYCPLCGSGSSGPYDRGFALPEGLRRHITGFGNAGPCDVLSPVLDLARDYWMPLVEKVEVERETERRAVLERRRESEEMYVLGPNARPLLNDEDIGYGPTARDHESLIRAEDRLEQLSFENIGDGQVRRFTKTIDDYIIYADHREAGRLTFYVYPLHKSSTAKRRGRAPTRRQSFFLLDTWRKDLDWKFASRAAVAIDALRESSKR